MTSSSTPSNSLPNPSVSNDETIWESLKQAIASSSGFQRWQLERSGEQSAAESAAGDPPVADELSTLPLDQRVRRYLRETLETLAY
ncbi:hypothetical protein [Thermoleptolyngbya sp. C42_A2020_037]|uniref:hypothetical protein n=1 Tax=Thermoleptolyngbya sp. C42_A2020_037 TaxID=2747799 RepID=UPI0025ED6D5E|nr:hypothetical protein [Thermoleptolyngbya sp. C42_A2020_037]